MPNKKRVFRFEIFGKTVEASIGDKIIDDVDGDVCVVKRYSKSELMEHLSLSTNGSPWFILERGYRTVNGKFRNDFEIISE